MNITEVSIQGGKLVITSPDIADITRFVYHFKPGEYEIERRRKKRSTDANALCWKLCTEIANALRSDKDSIYVEMLKRYGQSDLVTILSEVNAGQYFKYYEECGRGTMRGREYTHYKVFRGSSEYDTREMNILIDGIIDEAKNLGIDVISEREKSLLLEEWGAR